MARPQSIIWFERLYLAAVALGLISAAMNWRVMQEQIAANPASSILPSWLMPAIVALGVGLNLLLWYFIARRRSVVAQWIVTILFVIGLFGLVSLFNGGVPSAMLPFSILNFVLNGAAVFMLFRPDTKRWFAGDGDLGQTFS